MSEATTRHLLDVGCGRNKVAQAIGVDRVGIEGVDVVADLERFPYPFVTNAFDEIHARHVIEHVASVVDFLDELHRIARPGARLYITTPHYSYAHSWRDPTHRWHLSSYTFDYFDVGHPAGYYLGRARFHVVSVEVKMLRMWRWLGVERLINAVTRHRRWRFFRKVWEEYLAFLLRAREIRAVLEVVK